MASTTYKMGLGTSTTMGADSKGPSTGAVALTAGLGGLLLYALFRRPKAYRSVGDMRDVEAKIRARGGDPYKYGF